MCDYAIVKLKDKPELMDIAAAWFHNKWGIPLTVYRESMEESLKEKVIVPARYVCLHRDTIVGGLGVIENDFHDRKDLTPNVCAVYTEEKYRGKGIAGKMLAYVCEDMKAMGIHTLYLVTDHSGFYERYGWEFLCPVQGIGEPNMSRMYMKRSYL
jgi:N-acetylglutamate synthase-like GNAT family acetyltransferase